MGSSYPGTNFFQDIGVVLFNLDETVVATLVIGVASLALLFLLERVMPRIPAALVVVEPPKPPVQRQPGRQPRR